MFGAQIVAVIRSIDMPANGILVPAHDPGSMNRYANGLSIHMRSIISGLGLMGVEEIVLSISIFLKAASESTWPGSLFSS